MVAGTVAAIDKVSLEPSLSVVTVTLLPATILFSRKFDVVSLEDTFALPSNVTLLATVSVSSAPALPTVNVIPVPACKAPPPPPRNLLVVSEDVTFTVPAVD